MKKQLLNLGKALNKAEQKTVNGGRGLPSLCQYECNGTSAILASSSTYCLLNYPAIIRNSPTCGGNDGGTDEIWA